MDNSLIVWAFTLIVGFPLMAIAFGEASDRLSRSGNPLGKVFYNLRRWVLPLTAVYLVSRQFLGVETPSIPLEFTTEHFLQVLETGLWVAVTYTILTLLSSIFTTRAQSKAGKSHSWQILVPGLFFQAARIALMLGMSAYVASNIWKIDLSQIATALGVGSVVIALALQDTLSNLVSGFLLVFESPFRIGDWLKVGDIEGEVIEMNWRAVRLQTREKDIIVIPNGVLGQETLNNYSLGDPYHIERVKVRFSYDDPPNLVRNAIKEAVLSISPVLDSPAPEVHISTYSEFYIEYEVEYTIDDYPIADKIMGEVLTRIYYTTRRYGLTIPLPQAVHYEIQGEPSQSGSSREELQKYLRSLPYFISLDNDAIATLAKSANIETYGIGEKVVEAGKEDRGLYIIRRGTVKLYVEDFQGSKHDVQTMSTGEFFGEMALFPGETSPVSGIVLEDLNAITIECDIITQLIEENGKFASEMNMLIKERKKSLALIQNVRSKNTSSLPKKNGRFSNSSILNNQYDSSI
ncbi:MAG: mechanosensitive ion channel [Cyanobacteria bacterium SBLK]|nr:mechanosensitive ion channel [Cyanobacteria bacterium SBLK]